MNFNQLVEFAKQNGYEEVDIIEADYGYIWHGKNQYGGTMKIQENWDSSNVWVEVINSSAVY